MPLTKITVMIHEQLFQGFNKQMDALHMKRDAFLDSMIDREVSHLAEEMAGKQVAPAARRFIAGELKRLGTKKVNLQVENSTADKLNRVVEDTNMVRDAFINRLILFLRSTAPVLKRLGLPEFHTNSLYKEWLDPLPISPLGAIAAVHSDPFYYLRFHIEKRYETGLYFAPLPRQLIGFSCYLEEFEVPGTDAYKKAQELADQMLDDLGSFESKVFTDTQEQGGTS